MFLGEVEELLELIDIKEFSKFIEPLFQQIARSVLSTHFQVSIAVQSQYLNTFCGVYSGMIIQKSVGYSWLPSWSDSHKPKCLTLTNSVFVILYLYFYELNVCMYTIAP